MSVKTGFQKITLHGDILFAANGPNIHSFRIPGYNHISSWKYPQPWLAPRDTAVKADIPTENAGVDVTAMATGSSATKEDEPQAVEDGPPSKRRKLESEPEQQGLSRQDGTEAAAGSEEQGVIGPDQAMKDMPGDAEGAKEGKGGKGKGQNGKKEKTRGNGKDYGLGFGKQKAVLDIPMFQCMATTTDGKYLVGVIGSTKTIWTFEHDGNGRLTELSQRPMPKRPCSIVITGDNKTILSADKFGDVYALPVVQESVDTASAEATPVSRSSTPSTPQPFKYQANPLTVHTKRNLMALEHQKRQAEKQIGLTEKSTLQPDFEHKLVLGHVSMLTDIILATHNGKEYIITADRDEHIRVTRGLPQSHVIENYCLGHKEFVNTLHIPKSHPHILISGGGDTDLFVWDWTKGELLQKVRVGYSADQNEEESPKLPLAVSGIASFDYEGESSTSVAVICESSSTTYRYELTHDHQLEFKGHQKLDGNAFDIVATDTSGAFIVSTDPNLATDSKKPDEPKEERSQSATNPGPHSFFSVFGALAPSAPIFTEAVDLVDDLPDERYADLKKALYTIETLRKTGYERKGDGEDEEGEAVEGSEGVKGEE